jgi:hypothetical protein
LQQRTEPEEIVFNRKSMDGLEVQTLGRVGGISETVGPSGFSPLNNRQCSALGFPAKNFFFLPATMTQIISSTAPYGHPPTHQSWFTFLDQEGAEGILLVRQPDAVNY